MNFFKKYGQALLIAMIALAVGLGCSEKKNNNPVTPSGGSIVCKDGEAWIAEGKAGGFIFAADSSLIAVTVYDDGSSGGRKIGKYSTSGDKLTLVYDAADYSSTVTYKVSGDKLTLTGEVETTVYTKRTGVHIDA